MSLVDGRPVARVYIPFPRNKRVSVSTHAQLDSDGRKLIRKALFSSMEAEGLRRTTGPDPIFPGSLLHMAG